MRSSFPRALAASAILAVLLVFAASATPASAEWGHFPQQVNGVDYSTGYPYMTAPYVYSKHNWAGGGHGHGQSYGYGHGYGHGQGCGCPSCCSNCGHAPVYYGDGKKPLWFFGAGGPVSLNPGHPHSAGYINVTKAPRDFFAFPPYAPNAPY